jgi:hypothetical protein
MEHRALATWVAEVESQTALELSGQADEGARDRQRRERSFSVLLVSVLTLFAVAVEGYHPYAEDGGLYMAGVKRLLDPTLYPHGTAFVLEPMRHSLFAPAVAGVVRLLRMTPDASLHRGLPIVLLALHLASIWATLFAAWMLAARCWRGRTARSGAVVLLACWLALPIAGTALLFMDAYATARSLSTPCMVLALAGALDMTARSGLRAQNAMRRRRGFVLCAVSLALAAAMHPLMAAYALGATLMLLAARSPNRTLRRCATAALAASALALAACLQAIAKPESADTIRVAMTRSYWFPAQWRWYEMAGLAAPLLILAIEAWVAAARSNAHRNAEGWVTQSMQAEDVRRALARMAIAVGATSCVIALLFARAVAATHLIARLQPLRTFHIVYLVMVLLLGARLGERVLRQSAWRWAAAMLLLGGIMLATERSAFPNSNHLELPGIAPRNPWAQAFLWVRDHTPKDALFALDADYINAPGEDAQCFRAIAQRSALPDYSKDGGEASIAPGLTAEWVRGQAAQQGLSAPATTDAERVSELLPLGVSWVVLKAGATTRFDCPYGNAAVKVCRLP